MIRNIASLCLALAVAAGSASAATYTVNSRNDSDDGSCDPAPGDCTLREAINDLNAAGSGAIDFDPAAFPHFNLDSIKPGSALPTISASPSTLDGSGAGVFAHFLHLVHQNLTCSPSLICELNSDVQGGETLCR